MPKSHAATVRWPQTLEVIVSSEDDAEIRRVSITNTGMRARDVQVTSYAELSLTTQASDAAHPALRICSSRRNLSPMSECLLATRTEAFAQMKRPCGWRTFWLWKAIP